MWEDARIKTYFFEMWEGARIMTYVLRVEGCKNKKIFLSTGVCKNKDYYFEVWENCKNKEFKVLLKVATKINILKTWEGARIKTYF